MRIGGLVLAGGRSRRFGAEKAMAILDGRPLLAHVAQALAAGCEAVAVNAPEGSGAAAWTRTAGLTLLPDPPRVADGPLSGVREGLAWAAAQGLDALTTTPCDTPRLPADFVERLAASLADRPAAQAAFAVTPGGTHPLCAMWRTFALPVLERALQDGAHPAVRALLADCGAHPVAFEDDAAFANLNMPDDLAALRPSLSPPS